jgi:hypothetical protein
MVEFVVGLVALLVLSAGLLQLGRLCREHTAVLIRAREYAGTYAMSDTYQLSLPGPQYLRDWEPGPDARSYSRDDEEIPGAGDMVRANLVHYTRPTDLEAHVPGNPLSTLEPSQQVIDGFHLVHGREESPAVPLYPIIRRLLYRADEIRMEGEAWLVWTKGIQ